MADREKKPKPRGRQKASKLEKHNIQFRPTGGNSQTERERNAGKEGGARRGEGDRNGSSRGKQ